MLGAALVKDVALFIELATAFDELRLLTAQEFVLLVVLGSLLGEGAPETIELGLFALEVLTLLGKHDPFVVEDGGLTRETSTLVVDLCALARQKCSVVVEGPLLLIDGLQTFGQLDEFGGAFVDDGLGRIQACSLRIEVRGAGIERRSVGVEL